MSKDKPLLISGEGRQKMLLIFRRARQKEFTVLEDFILRVIESRGGCPDKEIADALCLEKDDVASVLDGNDNLECIQGDASRRTLSDAFSRKQPDGIIIVGAGRQGGTTAPQNGVEIDADDDIVAFLEKLPLADESGLSNEQRKWRKENRAAVYRFAVLAAGNKKPDYRCGSIAVPCSLHCALGKFFPPKKQKQKQKEKRKKAKRS